MSIEAPGAGHVEMGMTEDERSEYRAGYITHLPNAVHENIVGLKAVLLEEEVSEATGAVLFRLDVVLNAWARENWKEFNIIDMKYLPGEPRAVMLLVAKVLNAKQQKELWDQGEAIRAFVSQYMAKKNALEFEVEEARAKAEEEAQKKALADAAEEARLIELGRQHEANCGKKGRKR